ncbi:uncharacterized protein F4822DRAFT_419409 [Hypoxylon trugodes]|uniref:uncharacterized protein n=1 Tax=Hypoxylon trugodes TaxID=326681 RepID=UPI0021908E1A|nr:uncharacterized protein F4822DRAFT_419409 [Hypoxylon trugodes]KAI1384326.1 hypothetical protein F4822DRAFT_419409 [Hypoxylon trugodes]
MHCLIGGKGIVNHPPGSGEYIDDTNKEMPYRNVKKVKTYNTRDSLIVTDPTTSLAISSLSRGDRTGSRAF